MSWSDDGDRSVLGLWLFKEIWTRWLWIFLRHSMDTFRQIRFQWIILFVPLWCPVNYFFRLLEKYPCQPWERDDKGNLPLHHEVHGVFSNGLQDGDVCFAQDNSRFVVERLLDCNPGAASFCRTARADHGFIYTQVYQWRCRSGTGQGKPQTLHRRDASCKLFPSSTAHCNASRRKSRTPLCHRRTLAKDS